MSNEVKIEDFIDKDELDEIVENCSFNILTKIDCFLSCF